MIDGRISPGFLGASPPRSTEAGSFLDGALRFITASLREIERYERARRKRGDIPQCADVILAKIALRNARHALEDRRDMEKA